MKVIDGKDAVLGRLASFAAKEALKGESIAIVNCKQVIITGNETNIRETFEKKRKRVGSGQKGPKFPRTSERIVKWAIRGMIPNYRKSRGKEAFNRIKCYNEIPKEFENAEKITINREKTNKNQKLERFTK